MPVNKENTNQCFKVVTGLQKSLIYFKASKVELYGLIYKYTLKNCVKYRTS